MSEHLPPLKNRPPVLAQVNWHERDVEIVTAVRIAAAQIRSDPGKPEKLTRSAIASKAGHLTLIQKQLDRLPLTAEALAELVETTEEFAVRRVYWVAERFRQKGIYPKHWQLMKQAGLKLYVAEMPKVREAIASALLHSEF